MPKLTQRRGDRDTTPGRCVNLDYCSIGMQRVLVEVPVNQPFVCPECGGRLRPPLSGRGSRPWVMPLVRVGVLTLGVGLGGVVGYMLGRVQPAVTKAVAVVSHDTLDQVNIARVALGLPKLSIDDLKTLPVAAPVPAPAPTAPPAAPKPAVPSPPQMVVERTYPQHSQALDTADPPPHLSDEQRFGQVVVDCSLGSLQVKPACRASNIRGGDAFSTAAVSWLEALAVQYGPGTRNGAPALLDHRWRVIFEDFSGSAAHGKAASAPR